MVMGQSPERGIESGCQHLRSGAPKSKGPLRDQEEVKGELMADCGPRAILNPQLVWPIDHHLIPTRSAPTTNDIGKEQRMTGYCQ